MYVPFSGLPEYRKRACTNLSRSRSELSLRSCRPWTVWPESMKRSNTSDWNRSHGALEVLMRPVVMERSAVASR